MKLDGRVAIVTGAGRGMGRDIAVTFAREGATVVVCGRTQATLSDVAAEIADGGGHVIAEATDVTNEAAVTHLVDSTLSRFGQIDVLVNSAAIYELARFVDYPLDSWKRIIEVNLHGTFLTCRAVLPSMMERGNGSIINMSSTAGKWGTLYQSAYNASKHAVIGLTRCLAVEAAPYGIRANAICPGSVESPMIEEQAERRGALFGVDARDAYAPVIARTAMRRMVQIKEISPLAVYLASDDSSAMTGQSITIDGGLIFS